MSTSGRRRRVAVRGFGIGVAAFAVGYLLTWVLAGREAESLTVGGALGGGVSDWMAVAWVFLDSHFVGTETPRVIGPGGDVWAGGGLVDTVALLDVEFLYAVPFAVLLLAGAVSASTVEAAEPRAGLVAGAAVALGYVLLAVAGVFVATAHGVNPSPLRGVVVAGVVYPVALGGIGGAAVGALAERG